MMHFISRPKEAIAFLKTGLIKRFREEESGAIAVILACSLSFLIICLGITIDLGNVFLNQLKMRNAVDLAGVSVSQLLPAKTTEVSGEELRAVIMNICQINGLKEEEISGEVNKSADGSEWYSAEIIAERKVNGMFAAFYTKGTSYIKVGIFVCAKESGTGTYEIVITDNSYYSKSPHYDED